PSFNTAGPSARRTRSNLPVRASHRSTRPVASLRSTHRRTRASPTATRRPSGDKAETVRILSRGTLSKWKRAPGGKVLSRCFGLAGLPPAAGTGGLACCPALAYHAPPAAVSNTAAVRTAPSHFPVIDVPPATVFAR